jgi:ABC-2 type transport system ATP-binding protein
MTPPPQEVAAIRAERLTKNFFKKTSFFSSKQTIKAVSELNLEIHRGEAVAFLGPNGAGKSTTIKLLCGILRPTEGKSWILGAPSGSTVANKQLGLVFGTKSHLWMFMTVRQSLELMGEIYHVTGKEKLNRIGFLSELFEIEPFLDRTPSSLSLGERMRCEIVTSLLHRPSVLLADEPTIGLDVIAKNRFRMLLKKWRAEEKATLLLTSHDCSDVEALCERAILINNGQIHYDSALQGLKSKLNSVRHIKLSLSTPVDCKEKLRPSKALLIEDAQLMKKFRIDLETMEISEIMHDLINIYQEAVVDISIEPISLETAISHFYERPS